MEWTPSFRLISHRYPAVAFFEDIADPEDWEALVEIEKLTDPAFDVGDLNQLSIEDRLTIPGAGWVLPSFTFLYPARFNGTSFGAYYASIDLETALSETIHHRTRLMQATLAPAQELDQLLILANISGDFDDVTNLSENMPEIYHEDDYRHSQLFADSRRGLNSLGIVYRSVRHLEGQCVAVFRARVISNIREGGNFTYVWNGSRIEGYYRKSKFKKLP